MMRLAALLLIAGAAAAVPARASAAATPTATAFRAAPGAVTVVGTGGERRLPVRFDRVGAPVLAAPGLVLALDGTVSIGEGWAEIRLDRRTYRFLVGAPIVVVDGSVEPLAGPASVTRDTLFVPFQFVAELLPRLAADHFRYDAATARLARVELLATATLPAGVSAGAAAGGGRRLPNGLRPGHVVTLDPGHGGVDPGNPGLFFPRGLKEKDVTLRIGSLLRDELKRRGVSVRMTRARDTLIALGDRGGYCTAACDLFVSIHVNSLPKRPGYTAARGYETYFLAEAKTEEAARVARMENEAVRFEATQDQDAPLEGLDFILKDLQLNEHLRESAVAAELVQRHLAKAHTGPDRGVKQAGFKVLTTARRPAILVEIGYSTNPEDGRLLTNPRSQREMAEALADAVVEYLLEYERRTGAAPGGAPVAAGGDS